MICSLPTMTGQRQVEGFGWGGRVGGGEGPFGGVFADDDAFDGGGVVVAVGEVALVAGESAFGGDKDVWATLTVHTRTLVALWNILSPNTIATQHDWPQYDSGSSVRVWVHILTATLTVSDSVDGALLCSCGNPEPAVS